MTGFACGYFYRWRGVPFITRKGIPFVGRDYRYAIGVQVGTSLADLAAPSNIQNPVVTPEMVTDVRCRGLADPFLLRHAGKWFMFMEVINAARRCGEIGYVVSADGRRWSYQGVVLREPFHLSYPFVFAYQNTMLQHEGLWWMFVSRNRFEDLLLYYAAELTGPWQPHPRSPIVYGQPEKARCAGRPVHLQGRLIRFAQDCSGVYGQRVRAFRVDQLNREQYQESELPESPVRSPSGAGWNAEGMHHIDLHVQEDGSCLAAVDGWRRVREIGWKY